jgi:hypothetical protein
VESGIVLHGHTLRAGAAPAVTWFLILQENSGKLPASLFAGH